MAPGGPMKRTLAVLSLVVFAFGCASRDTREREKTPTTLSQNFPLPQQASPAPPRLPLQLEADRTPASLPFLDDLEPRTEARERFTTRNASDRNWAETPRDIASTPEIENRTGKWMLWLGLVAVALIASAVLWRRSQNS